MPNNLTVVLKVKWLDDRLKDTNTAVELLKRNTSESIPYNLELMRKDLHTSLDSLIDELIEEEKQNG